MLNLSEFFLIVAIAHSCWKLCVFCHDDDVAQFFRVNENESMVELFFSKKIPRKQEEDSETGLMKTNAITNPKICSLPYDQKLLLCKHMIRTSYFGFTFDLPVPRVDVKCSLHAVSLKICALEDCSTVGVDMYPCPPIMYLDLETGEFNVLPVGNFISGTHTENGLLYYSQEDDSSPIYPKKMDLDLILEYLDHLSSAQKISELRDEKVKKSLKFEVQDSEIESKFIRAMRIRNSPKPYVKFRFTLSSTSVCGLPRKYKIHACRMLAKYDPKIGSEVFHLGYNETTCYKREVFVANPQQLELLNGSWVMMYKCPPLYQGHFGERPRFRATTKFLSSSMAKNSVFSYARRNSWGRKIRPDGFVRDINFDDFAQDRRRTREFLKPNYLLEYESSLRDSKRSLSSLTSQLSLGFSSLQIIFDRDIVEDEVIFLANLIGEKRPYERFRRTLSILSMSSWTRDDIAYLCSQVLRQKPYDLKMQPHFPGPSANYCPSRLIRVKLAMRDAEWLRRQKMLASQCPPLMGYAYQYFVSGGMQMNSVVFYVRYGYEDFAFPDSVVIRVNDIFEEDYVELTGEEYAADEFEENIFE